MRYRTPNWTNFNASALTSGAVPDIFISPWFDTPEKALDLRKNPGMSANPYTGEMTGNKLFKFLNAIYPEEYMKQIHVHEFTQHGLLGLATSALERITSSENYDPNWLYLFVFMYHGSSSNLYIRTPDDSYIIDQSATEDTWTCITTRLHARYTSLKNSRSISFQSGSLRAIYHYNFLRKAFYIGIGGSSDYYKVDEMPCATNEILPQITDQYKFKIENKNAWTNMTAGSWTLRYTPAGPVNKSRLYRTFSHSQNVMSVLGEEFISEPKEFRPPFYGVELELCTDYTERQIIDACEEPFFILKADSSITGNKSRMYELVTLPMSIVAHKKRFAHLFSNLDYKMFDRTITTNNGMHVHISKDAFLDTKTKQADSHLRKFSYFFINPANFQFLLTVSERTEDSLQRWAPIPHRFGNGTTTKSLYQNSAALWSRGALNFGSNKPTVEVRLFKGIVSFSTVVKNLEFTDSVFFFTQQATRSTLTLKHYLLWLKAQPNNKYKTLREFYRRVNINNFVKESDLLNEIFRFGFDQPNVVKALTSIKEADLKENRKVSLSLMANVAKCIKRIIPTFSYVFNKRTGRFEEDTRNLSKLHDLDMTLEKLFKKDKQKGEKFSIPQSSEPNDNNDETESGPVFDEMSRAFPVYNIHDDIMDPNWTPNPALFVNNEYSAFRIYPPRDTSRPIAGSTYEDRHYLSTMGGWYWCRNGRYC